MPGVYPSAVAQFTKKRDNDDTFPNSAEDVNALQDEVNSIQATVGAGIVSDPVQPTPIEIIGPTSAYNDPFYEWGVLPRYSLKWDTLKSRLASPAQHHVFSEQGGCAVRSMEGALLEPGRDVSVTVRESGLYSVRARVSRRRYYFDNQPWHVDAHTEKITVTSPERSEVIYQHTFRPVLESQLIGVVAYLNAGDVITANGTTYGPPQAPPGRLLPHSDYFGKDPEFEHIIGIALRFRG